MHEEARAEEPLLLLPPSFSPRGATYPQRPHWELLLGSFLWRSRFPWRSLPLMPTSQLFFGSTHLSFSSCLLTPRRRGHVSQVLTERLECGCLPAMAAWRRATVVTQSQLANAE